MKLMFTVIGLALVALVVAQLPPGSLTSLDLKTNTLALIRTNGYAEIFVKQALLYQAITNGEVCAIKGHQWRPYTGMITHYPEDPPATLHVCGLCQRVEQQICVWREVEVDQIGMIKPKP